MTPVEEIKKAAALMRERAEAATAGPWWCEEDDLVWQLHGVAGTYRWHEDFPETVVNKQIVKAPKKGTTYAEYWPEPADAQHIVSWHPAVALAVADWLEYTALTLAHHGMFQEKQALAVARAYMGGE